MNDSTRAYLLANGVTATEIAAAEAANDQADAFIALTAPVAVRAHRLAIAEDYDTLQRPLSELAGIMLDAGFVFESFQWRVVQALLAHGAALAAECEDLRGAAALPAGVSLEGAQDGRSDDQECQQAADEHPEGAGGDPEHESSGNSVHESDVTE